MRKILFYIILGLVASYTAFWFIVSNYMKTHIHDNLSKQMKDFNLNYSSLDIKGFPFSFNLLFEDVVINQSILDQKTNVKLDNISIKIPLFSNNIKTILSQKIQFNNYVFIFTDTPVIDINIENNLLLNSLVNSDNNISKINFTEKGYKIKQNEEIFFESTGSIFNYDRSGLLNFSLSGINLKNQIPFNMDVISNKNFSSDKNEFIIKKAICSYDNMILALDGKLSNLSTKKLSFHFNLELVNYEKIIDVFFSFFNYKNLDKNILKHILLKTSGNSQDDGIKNIRISLIKKPVGQVVLGDVPLKDVFSYYIKTKKQILIDKIIKK